ncbi:MAG: hypothetical protein JJU20_03360 [Opitutales bacterium]|nr:hypothetical protein [Opitutales bacterium]
MQLQSIITLASKPVELMFRAMERSLRATGCDLPVRVIPFSDDRFDLPEGSEWWEIPEFISWIDTAGRRPVMRKYQALLGSNYQFVDTDVIFLRNPQDVLSPHSGFVTSCTHWHNPDQTVTSESRAILQNRSTIWQSRVFNTGQFASEEQLYTLNDLKKVAADKRYRRTILEDSFHEQPGINLLVNLSRTPITNRTLTPMQMESTWAGDYLDEDYNRYWVDEEKKPYLIHWAGRKMQEDQAIAQLFFQYLSKEEREDFINQNSIPEERNTITLRLKRAIRLFLRELRKKS